MNDNLVLTAPRQAETHRRPDQTTRIVVDGVSLAVHRTGRGVPIVGLTAIGHDAHDFDAFATAVADRFETIVIEWPSHGDSGPDPQPASASRYADLIVAALDQLGLERPIVIGNSIGGSVAIRYADRRPVRALVLCNCGLLPEVTPFAAWYCGLFARFFAAGERGAWWYDFVFRRYYHLVLTEPAAAAQRSKVIANGRRFASIFRQVWGSFTRPEAYVGDVMLQLDCPIWIAWGERDKVIPLWLCRPTIKRMKHATLSTFRAGHCAFLEQPEAFTVGFLAFAGQHPGQQS
jgi:pimeloyl-ACP methyl ester carboxylesterase